MYTMKNPLLIVVAICLCFALSACGCNHEYDNGVITSDATCTSEGVKTYTCSLCGETKTDVIPVTTHVYDNGVITSDATCTAEGVKTYTCSLCGETKTDAIPVTAHVYEAQITEQPTFTETGVMTYTCSICGDSYTESIPVRDDEVVVTVTGKTNLAENWDAGRYSDRVEFAFLIENMTDRSIKGIQGTLTVKDLFGSNILSINCDFTGQTISPNSSITMADLGMDINEFMDTHVKLYNEDYSDLIFEYEVSNVVFTDGQSSQDTTEVSSLDSSKVIVTITDKINLSENWNAGRYSPRVEFNFTLANTTEKDIKGIQGVLTVKDMFGVDIISFNCDFTGNTIPAKSSISVGNLGIDINEFMDEHVKLYSEDYSDLIFEYNVTSIVYVDGTTE